MKSKRRALAGVSLLLVLALLGNTGRLALPGYRFEFPRDDFDHPDFDAEWWYYTGNLTAADGHEFGYELTFFRQAVAPANASSGGVAPVWRTGQLYLAHLALSDLTGKRFYYTERLNRAGPGLAGADAATGRVWNGNWQAQWISSQTNEQRLRAVTAALRLNLDLKPLKPRVIHGEDGVSRKGLAPDQASHYYSFTRIATSGTLAWQNQIFRVNGLSWMDHEFFSENLANAGGGWDWFCVQLDGGEELMLYRLRNRDGSISPYSSGTWIDAAGKPRFLPSTQFSLQPLATWRSPETGGAYPIAWDVRVPALSLALRLTTPLQNQELVNHNGLGPSYWEGAVRYAGTRLEHPVKGVGYLEMTGYAKPNR